MRRGPKRAKIGRPPAANRVARRVVIYVRGDQHAQLEKVANDWRGPVSSYVREMLCRARVIAR